MEQLDHFEIIKQAKNAWNEGRFILLHDSRKREDEVDMIIPSINITPKHIAKMRTLGGGLICTAVTHEFAHAITLPFMKTLLRYVAPNYPLVKKIISHGLPYGASSSFSLTVNHVDAFTGITDKDRALTIKTVGELAQDYATHKITARELLELFGDNFRAPGHVHLLRAKSNLLLNRQGHTELSLALAELTNHSPSITMVEMMDSKTNEALKVDKAKEISKKYNWPLVEGSVILSMWKNIKGYTSKDFKKISL